MTDVPEMPLFSPSFQAQFSMKKVIVRPPLWSPLVTAASWGVTCAIQVSLVKGGAGRGPGWGVGGCRRS